MRQAFAIVCLLLAACSTPQPAAPSYQPFAQMFLTRVEPKKVCMINEKVFVDDQIPVTVGDKVYYGCCAMCKTTLAEDASKRTATDPISGKTVDKADAVIGVDTRGTVYYFQSEANLRAFRP